MNGFQKKKKMDLDENERFSKGKFYRVMILCLDLYKGDQDKGSNTIYATIKKGFLYYIGITQSKVDVLKKQILIVIVNKFENIDAEELLNRLQEMISI